MKIMQLKKNAGCLNNRTLYMFGHSNNVNRNTYILSYVFNQSVSQEFLFFFLEFSVSRLHFQLVAHDNNTVLSIQLACVISRCFQSFQCIQECCLILCTSFFFFFSPSFFTTVLSVNTGSLNHDARSKHVPVYT